MKRFLYGYFLLCITLAGCNDNSSNTGLTDPSPLSCTSEIDLLPESVSEAIDMLVTTEMNMEHIQGITVAVAQEGKTVLAKGYGVANSTSNPSVLACADTPFELGSVTKSFTTIGLLLILDNPSLNKSGIPLDLDAPISEYLGSHPGFTLPQAWENITIRQLLSMSSGIPDLGSNTLTWPQILDKVGMEPLVFSPGTGYCYSNPAFMVIGAIIQQLTGMPYSEFMQENVFTPLNMNDTIIHTPDNTPSNLATGYKFDPNTMMWITPTPRPPLSSFSAGAIISTAIDLGTFLSALQQRLLLNSSTYDSMWTPVELQDPMRTGPWGLGWEVNVTDQHQIYRKDGSLPGFSAQLSLYDGDKVYVAIASNEDSISYVHLAAQIVAAVIGVEEVPNPPSPSESCVSVTADPDAIRGGETATVIAQTTNLSGISICFEILPPNSTPSSKVEPECDNTNESGQAQTVLTAGLVTSPSNQVIAVGVCPDLDSNGMCNSGEPVNITDVTICPADAMTCP